MYIQPPNPTSSQCPLCGCCLCPWTPTWSILQQVCFQARAVEFLISLPLGSLTQGNIPESLSKNKSSVLPPNPSLYNLPPGKMADLGPCPPICSFLVKGAPNQGWTGLCLHLKSCRVWVRGSAPVQGGSPTLTGETLGAPSIWASLERSEQPCRVLSEYILGEAQSTRGRTVRKGRKGMEGPREALPSSFCTIILGGSCSQET